MSLIKDVLIGFKKALSREEPSKERAKRRLKLLLIQDRATIAPEVLGLIRDEIIGVISRYIEVEEEGAELSIEMMGEEYALIANIPIKDVKRSAVRDAMRRARGDYEI